MKHQFNKRISIKVTSIKRWLSYSYNRAALSILVGLILLTYTASVLSHVKQIETDAISKDGTWQRIAADSPSLIKTEKERWIVPERYRAFQLDEDALMGILRQAPMELTDAA